MRRLLSWMTLLVVGSIVASSCGPDAPLTTEPRPFAPKLSQESSRGDTLPEILAPGALESAGFQPARLPLIPANLDQCEVVVRDDVSPGSTPRKGQFRLRGTNRPSHATPLSPAELTYIETMQFDRATKQLRVHALCVVPKGMGEYALAKGALAAFDPREVSSEPLASIRADLGGFGNGWDTGLIICYRYGEDDPVIECEGSECSQYAQVRNQDFDRYASVQTYYCPNGCVVATGSGGAAYACPGGGAGGGGSEGETSWAGGGGGSYEWPGVQMIDNDGPAEATIPNCDPLPADPGARAWCLAKQPTALAVANIRGSIARLTARGGFCATLAAAADTILTEGKLRVFLPDSTQNFSGAAGINGDWALLDLWVVLTMTGDEKDDTGMNLDALIAHEMDHHFDQRNSSTNPRGHLMVNGVANPYKTIHSDECSPSNS